MLTEGKRDRREGDSGKEEVEENRKKCGENLLGLGHDLGAGI